MPIWHKIPTQRPLDVLDALWTSKGRLLDVGRALFTVFGVNRSQMLDVAGSIFASS